MNEIAIIVGAIVIGVWFGPVWGLVAAGSWLLYNALEL